MNIDKGKSSSVMRARQRAVVYWPTLNYQNVEQLSVEQIMLKSVDEAEEAEFEQTQVKFFDDLYSSIKNDSSFESNNNILNTVSSACEDACNHIADVACMNDADDHCTAGGVKVCVLDNCDVSKEAPFTSPMPSEKEGALISSETEFHETRGAYEVTENFSNIELRGQNALLHTQKNDCIVNCSLPSAQTAFDLANLRDSLPRLVITAPERLHDEVTGAFTLYSGIDTPRASLWSARLNFAASTMVAAQHSDDGESLDTSCCSIDSIVTASSIESGPRTFYDPALHRPTHLTGTVLAPVCNSGEIFKKPVCSSLTSVSAESQEQGKTVNVEDCQNESRACRASTMSNVRGFGHTSRSLLLTQRQPRTVGRAITKLTFSPRKESMNTVVEKPHETVKRDWRSMYAASPCAYKRSCHRSTTPKFDSANFSLAANYLQTNGASGCPLASPIIQDHQPGIANSRCKTPKSSISLQASLSRLPPRYSACEAVSQVLPANQRAWHKTNYTDRLGQSRRKEGAHAKRTMAVTASPPRKRSPLAPAYSNITLHQSPAADTLSCNDKQLKTLTMVHTLLNSQKHDRVIHKVPTPSVTRMITSKKQHGRLHFHPPVAGSGISSSRVAISAKSVLNLKALLTEHPTGLAQITELEKTGVNV